MMDPTAIGWVTGAALVAVELGRSVPALTRLRKQRSSDAVSPESIGILAGSGAGWVLLAWLIGAWPVLVATTLWLVLHLLICSMVWRVSPGKRRRMLWSVVVTAIVFATATAALSPLLGVTAALGMLLGLATVLDSGPALIEGLTSPTTRGLSALSLAVNTTEAVIYLAFGSGWAITFGPHGSLIGYLLYGGVSLTANVPRLVRVIVRRRRGLD